MRNYILTRELDEITKYMNPETMEEVRSKIDSSWTARRYIIEYLMINGDIQQLLVYELNIDILELKELEHIDFQNLLTLENKILTREEVESLNLNPYVRHIDDLGYSSLHHGYYWANMCLVDGSILDIYYE